MKRFFSSSQNLFSFLRYSNFCPHLFSHLRTRLEERLRRYNWKTITINVLPNISRNKDKQIMKLGQLSFISGLYHSFNIFRWLILYKTFILYKTLDCSSRDILNFNFLEKGQEIVSPTNFMYEFSNKMFLML